MPNQKSNAFDPAPGPSATGWQAYVVNNFVNSSAIVKFQTDVPARNSSKSEANSFLLGCTRTGKYLCVANNVPGANRVDVFIAETMGVAGTIPMSVAGLIADVISAPSSGLVYTSQKPLSTVSVVDPSTLSVLSSCTIPGSPQINRMATTPDGTLLFVMADAGGSLFVLDVGAGNTLTYRQTIALPNAGSGTIWVAPDGKLAYVSAKNDSVVNVLNVTTLSFVGSPIALGPAGLGPFGMIILPTGKTLWTANLTNSTISMIDLETQTLLATLPTPMPIDHDFWSVATPDSKKLFLIDQTAFPGHIDDLDIDELKQTVLTSPQTPLINQDIVVDPDPSPVANFVASWRSPAKNHKFVTVAFDATASWSPVGSIASSAWDFGDGTGILRTTSPKISHRFRPSKTPRKVQLKVTNTAGTSTDVVFLSRQVSNAGSAQAQTFAPLSLKPHKKKRHHPKFSCDPCTC